MKTTAIVLAMVSVLAGCNSLSHRRAVARPAPAVVIEAAPRNCGAIQAEWLKRQSVVPKAEGVVADADAIAVARGAQVDLANERIMAANSGASKVLSALKQHGCVEVKDGR